jgi:hypothetical protein
MATPPQAPKVKALAKTPQVSLTIDDNTFPHQVLLIRSTAKLQPVDEIVPEYGAAAERYFGQEQGQAWLAQLRRMIPGMLRIAVTPVWVGLLDFQTRFPSALSAQLESQNNLLLQVCGSLRDALDPAQVPPVIFVGTKREDLFSLRGQTQVSADNREGPFFTYLTKQPRGNYVDAGKGQRPGWSWSAEALLFPIASRSPAGKL